MGPQIRRAVEYSLLLCALFSLTILAHLHWNFIRSHGEFCCLKSHFEGSQHAQIINIKILSPELIPPLSQETHKQPNVISHKHSVVGYSFAVEKGYIILQNELGETSAAQMVNVTIPTSSPCFGSSTIALIVEHIIGYDTILMNDLIRLFGGRGYLYNIQSKQLFNLSYAAEFITTTASPLGFIIFKLGILFTTLFLFFTTTTLVSFTLRETQKRMLKFTFLLQHHIRNRIPYARLVLTHVVESLVFVPIMVGMLFFLFEFFNDQLLAFMMLSVVWLCELFSVVSVRTRISIKSFPLIFFWYFSLFHVYFFSFPFGFSYLALFTVILFLQHAMFYLWSRFEVPALLGGYVSYATPRQLALTQHGVIEVTEGQVHVTTNNTNDGQASDNQATEGVQSQWISYRRRRILYSSDLD